MDDTLVPKTIWDNKWVSDKSLSKCLYLIVSQHKLYYCTKIMGYIIVTFVFSAYPCESLILNNNSAKLCTNWKNDFGQYCLVFCDKSHTLGNENEFDQWFVCGASGHWNPAPALPKCDSKLLYRICFLAFVYLFVFIIIL